MILILFLHEPACGLGFNLKQAFSELINRSAHLLPSHLEPQKNNYPGEKTKETYGMSPNNVEIAAAPAFPGWP